VLLEHADRWFEDHPSWKSILAAHIQPRLWRVCDFQHKYFLMWKFRVEKQKFSRARSLCYFCIFCNLYFLALCLFSYLICYTECAFLARNRSTFGYWKRKIGFKEIWSHFWLKRIVGCLIIVSVVHYCTLKKISENSHKCLKMP
jgi:hypothetical protein